MIASPGRGLPFKVLTLFALLLQAALLPGFAHATEAAGAIPAPPKDPGASETQIFWQQRNRDHLILQQRTLSNQLMIYENLHGSGDTAKLKSELGAFCAASEGAGSCLTRYKRAAARQLEDIKGALLRSEDEITRLRSDIPGQGGMAVERGGSISGPDDNPDAQKNHTSFTAKSKNPTELLGPAYVPTLEELDTRARAYRSKQSGYTSNEHRYQNWAQSTFSKADSNTDQSMNENYALFQAVKPMNPAAGGEAPLRRIQTQPGAGGDRGIVIDQKKKAAAIQSLELNASNDLARAEEAKQLAIKELERREVREKNPANQIRDKYTQSEVDALNLARGEIIQAYTDKLAETKPPAPKPSASGSATAGKAALTSIKPNEKAEDSSGSSGSGSAASRRRVAGGAPAAKDVHAQVTGKTMAAPSGGPISNYADSPSYNDRPVEGQLLEPKDYHIYMDPSGIDEQIENLRAP